MRSTFEYHAEYLNRPGFYDINLDQLNQLGAAGWEFAARLPSNSDNTTLALFKRSSFELEPPIRPAVLAVALALPCWAALGVLLWHFIR